MSENRPTPKDDRTDPLATLYRMSTTAGAASQDYVAINLAAVAALVFGVASALVFFGNVLFIVPVAAIVFGIAAIRQVRNSNGTQTGMGMAVLGIVLAIAMSVAVGVQKYQKVQEENVELAAIERVVDEFEKYIVAGDYAGSLKVFSDRFPESKQVTPERVTQVWQTATGNEAFGKIESVTTNDRIGLGEVAPDGTRSAASMLLIKFEKINDPLRRKVGFLKSGGEWKIDDLPELFPPPPPTPPAGPT